MDTPPTILVAEDDPDDRLLLREALDVARIGATAQFVVDGVELLDTLHRSAALAVEGQESLPALILLDLNMPRMDGRDVLEELKGSAALAAIPVIVFTTSRSPDDIKRAREQDVDAYLIKPSSFDALVELVESLPNYWRPRQAWAGE